MTNIATIHEGVEFTPGDGAPIEIPAGPAEFVKSADSVTLSWTEDNDALGSAALPRAEFDRYLREGKITLGS